jgi:hypothetical protein
LELEFLGAQRFARGWRSWPRLGHDHMTRTRGRRPKRWRCGTDHGRGNLPCFRRMDRTRGSYRLTWPSRLVRCTAHAAVGAMVLADGEAQVRRVGRRMAPPESARPSAIGTLAGLFWQLPVMSGRARRCLAHHSRTPRAWSCPRQDRQGCECTKVPARLAKSNQRSQPRDPHTASPCTHYSMAGTPRAHVGNAEQ